MQDPLILRLPVVIGTPLFLLLIGIGLEIAIFISNHNNGALPILVMSHCIRGLVL